GSCRGVDVCNHCTVVSTLNAPGSCTNQRSVRSQHKRRRITLLLIRTCVRNGRCCAVGECYFIVAFTGTVRDCPTKCYTLTSEESVDLTRGRSRCYDTCSVCTTYDRPLSCSRYGSIACERKCSVITLFLVRPCTCHGGKCTVRQRHFVKARARSIRDRPAQRDT